MILVTGGAGYIGSHVIRLLHNLKEQTIVLDNLSRGHKDALPSGVPLVVGDIRDEQLLETILDSYKIDAVIHFAAESLVGESMKDPGKYFQNNVGNTVVLIDTCARYGVNSFVFSSSAAVYGEPELVPITEQTYTVPSNVYGQTKLMIEQMLVWYDRIYGMKHTCLRYFNAAGADESGEIGEDHTPETHLIPLVMQVALGIREKLTVYGNDYPTVDGTCIRDYIHVTDLAQAHVLALKRLQSGWPSDVFNLGSGSGYSVKEVLDMACQVVGEQISYDIGPRRSGDPAVLVASSAKAAVQLGWYPRYGLKEIVASSWNWHKNHPYGFRKEPYNKLVLG